jgi:hypothetical protein
MELYIKPKSRLVSHSQFRIRRQHAKRSQEFAMLRTKMKRRAKRIRPKQTSLVFLEQSPNYCEADSLKAVVGTKSRACKRSTIESTNSQDVEEGSCEILCCGRGYSTYEILKKWKCQCKFTWCCTVECNECEKLVEVYTCNWPWIDQWFIKILGNLGNNFVAYCLDTEIVCCVLRRRRVPKCLDHSMHKDHVNVNGRGRWILVYFSV